MGIDAMDALLRFALRAATAFRHPLGFARTHPKKLEAIGLFMLLVAAFFQVQSDSYKSWLLSFQINEALGDSQFTRQQVMGLIECQQKASCSDWDRERVKPELNSFVPLDAPETLAFWQTMRTVVFVLGSGLILLAKWLDGRPLKTIRVGGNSHFARRYRALRQVR